jgi:hypothetical protein
LLDLSHAGGDVGAAVRNRAVTRSQYHCDRIQKGENTTMKARHLIMTLAMLAGLVVGHSSASAQGAPLFAVLNGGNEVSNAGGANVGDQNGYGSASIVLANNTTVCFTIIVVGIDTPNQNPGAGAHIHANKAGLNGPIVIPLVPPTTGNRGASSGCVTGVDSALIRDIRTTPSNFYVNVHTGQFPAGAVRGQLF